MIAALLVLLIGLGAAIVLPAPWCLLALLPAAAAILAASNERDRRRAR